MPTFMKCNDCKKKYYTSSSIPEEQVVGECENCSGVLISLGPPRQDPDSSEE